MSRRKRSQIPPHKLYQTRITPQPSRKLNYLIGLLSLVVLIFASSTVLKIVQGETHSLPIQNSYLRVQVLNGCGIPKAAANMGQIIKRLDVDNVDVDVIDEDNFDTFDISETMILARDERAHAEAVRIGEMIGIHPDNVVVQPLDDNYLSLDLTIIVGKDFETIANRAGAITE